ncbi:hypothetical protein WOLCODRAFT_151099 [Wolfiporia cocos MD-104 SS10]|uniref:Uncharacterized protein n=1 Tax=Wolfiporia cocos (strain MD-104) TaxID=742152 RepID=A0A2H3JWF5_WOLCO|nr:hypothetical protein WOLCODRAFT_151099 [Wolfiporia cocos MD-104 SS10]
MAFNFKKQSNHKTPRHSMIRRFKATFLGIVVRVHRVSTVRRVGRLVEQGRGTHQPPVAEDSVSSVSSGSVVIIPWDRPPEIFERPAGMAPDPVLEACLQLYRDYYEGRLRYGPNGEPIYVTQHPDHPDADVGMDTSGSVMSREDIQGGRAQLSPAAAYAFTQARRLGLSTEKNMVQSGHGNDRLPGQTDTDTAAVEGQEVIEWTCFEATDGSQGTELYAVYDALGPASGDLVTEPMDVDVNDIPI